MDLIERTAVEMSDVIRTVVLARTAFTPEEITIIYGSEQKRQAIASALAQRTQAGKVWLDLMSWNKINEVAQKNTSAADALSAYETLTEGTFRMCDTSAVFNKVAALPEFWDWCRTNSVVYIPIDGGASWMICLADETQETFQRIEHEFAVMYRRAQEREIVAQ